MIKKKKVLTIKDIALLPMLAVVLFVQEQLLMVLPNIQLTVLLLVLYSKKIGTLKTLFIIFIYVLLDNLFMGNLIYMPFMIIGWSLIPCLTNTLFNKINSNIGLAFLGILYAFLYSWIFLIPSCLIFEIDFKVYLVMDLLWEIMLAMSSFVSILLLYTPLSQVFDKLKVHSR